MVSSGDLKDLFQCDQISRLDCIVFMLSVEGKDTYEIKELKKLAIESGLREIEKWNVSMILSQSKGHVVRVKDGWTLTSKGRIYAGELLQRVGYKSKKSKVIGEFSQLLANISDPQTKMFVKEAILCFEQELWRAAVVLSWVGAVSVLQEHVVSHELVQFNAEATRRDAKYKQAKNKDDLSRVKESEFLDILEAISVLGKSVKTDLKACLDRRNGCGHPNSFRIGEQIVAAHIETLVLNVFLRF